MRTQAPSTSLERRNFGLLWLARLISDAGDWLLMIALPVHVLSLTGSSLATAAVFLAELAPALLLGSVAGVLADRWDRRQALVVVNLAQSVLLLPLLAANSRDRLWIVLAVAVVQSSLARLAGPATFGLVPAVVGPGQLTRANSLIGVSDNLARLLGSPLGGIVFELGRLPAVVAVDAVTFLASAALVALIRIAPRPATVEPATGDPATAGSFVRTWLDGLRVVARSRQVAAVFVVGGLGQLAQGFFVVLFVLFVERSLHGDGSAVGLLRGVQAIGAVLGGLLLSVLARRVRASALAGYGFLVFGLVDLTTWNAPAVSTALGLYVALFTAAGVPGLAAVTGLLTVAQSHTPGSHLGRVAGAFEATAAGAQALGVLVAGLLGDRVVLLPLLDAQAGLIALGGVVALALLGTAVRAPAPPTRATVQAAV